jgi:hypothetical protein
MASINEQGNIQACCPECHGALSTFEWNSKDKIYGSITRADIAESTCYRLYRCAGCGSGALAVVRFTGKLWPGDTRQLLTFHSEAAERLPLPRDLPQVIVNEFREAEKCLDAGCLRAAMGLFRSVLVKVLRANGYPVDRNLPLSHQMDTVAGDGIITKARHRKAARVLGHDIIDDEWHEPPRIDLEALRRFTQRILEDLYEDRAATVLMLRDAGRLINEEKNMPVPVSAPPTGRKFFPQSLQ